MKNEVTTWNKLYMDLLSIIQNLENDYKNNPTKSKLKELHSYLKEQKEYLKMIKDLSNQKFNKFYYDLLNKEDKIDYLNVQLKRLENINGKKCLITNNDGKKVNVSKAKKSEYLKYLLMLNNLEEIKQPVFLDNMKIVDINKAIKEQPTKPLKVIHTRKSSFSKKIAIASILIASLSLTSLVTTKAMDFESTIETPMEFPNIIVENNIGNIQPIEKEENLIIDANAFYNEQLAMKETKENTLNSYLTKYANYYHFDANKVIELAKVLTNNYQVNIQNVNNNYNYNLSSDEAACMVFVNQLNRDDLMFNLNDLGYSINDFKLDNNIETLNNNVLSNGLSYAQNLEIISNLLNLDKEYALAISLYETGRLTSSQAVNKNNFGGLKGNDGSHTYASPEAGLIAYCCNLKNYEDYNIKNIDELSGIYSQGNRNKPNKLWTNSVLSIHSEVQENPNEFFMNSNNEIKLLYYK